MSELVDTRTQSEPTSETEVTEARLQRVEKDIEKSDIDDLALRAASLRDMETGTRGLEATILKHGLQVIVDQYGADKVISAIEGGSLDTKDIINQLATSQEEKDSLYQAIEQEPMDTLGEKFNETIGGISAVGDETFDGLARGRRYGVEDLKSEKDTQPGLDWLASRDNFVGVLESHPEIKERFVASGDTVSLLKDIRELHESAQAQFAQDLEAAKANVEAKVREAEAGIAELQAVSDEILTEEIVNLEKRLAEASNDALREVIQTMLDGKAEAASQAQEGFDAALSGVRTQLEAELGISRLEQIRASELTRPRTSFSYEEQVAA